VKSIITLSKTLSALMLLALAVGCASNLQNKENMAVTAGFKVIAPANAEESTILTSLPRGKVTVVKYHQKTYYVLPDAKDGQAYVGGPAEYQAYRQLRAAAQLKQEQLQAAGQERLSKMSGRAFGPY
jgi:hypothetical protein